MSSYHGDESLYDFNILMISKSVTEFKNMEFIILFFK